MPQPPYVTPLVKKTAAARGVDLTQVDGTGVGGRIRVSDVIAAAARPPVQIAASTPAPSQMLPVAPRNAQEAAAALGPRPGSDWFGGYDVLASERAAQADWDAQVARFATYEDHEAAQAYGRMHLGGGKTYDQALAEVRAMGDPGAPGA